MFYRCIGRIARSRRLARWARGVAGSHHDEPPGRVWRFATQCGSSQQSGPPHRVPAACL